MGSRPIRRTEYTVLRGPENSLWLRSSPSESERRPRLQLFEVGRWVPQVGRQRRPKSPHERSQAKRRRGADRGENRCCSRGGHDTSDPACRRIHSTLDPIAAKNRTTAVLETSGDDIIGGGVRDLSPAQRKLQQPGEILASSRRTRRNHRIARGKSTRAQAEGHCDHEDFCPECRSALEEAGARSRSTNGSLGMMRILLW